MTLVIGGVLSNHTCDRGGVILSHVLIGGVLSYHSCDRGGGALSNVFSSGMLSYHTCDRGCAILSPGVLRYHPACYLTTRVIRRFLITRVVRYAKGHFLLITSFGWLFCGGVSPFVRSFAQCWVYPYVGAPAADVDVSIAPAACRCFRDQSVLCVCRHPSVPPVCSCFRQSIGRSFRLSVSPFVGFIDQVVDRRQVVLRRRISNVKNTDYVKLKKELKNIHIPGIYNIHKPGIYVYIYQVDR